MMWGIMVLLSQETFDNPSQKVRYKEKNYQSHDRHREDLSYIIPILLPQLFLSLFQSHCFNFL